jgi:hypothetical protein
MRGAEPLKQVPVALETGAQHSGDGQDIMAVGHRSHHLVHDEPGGSLDIFLVAGRAEPPAFAGEGQQVLMLAMVAADSREAAFEIATVQKLVNDLGNDRAQAAVAGLVSCRVKLLELVVMAVRARASS